MPPLAFPGRDEIDALVANSGRPIDVVIIGGGCYGTSYARRLTPARARSKVPPLRVRVVDRDPDCQTARELTPGPQASAGAVDVELVIEVADWYTFGVEYLREKTAATTDLLVPAPLAPHIFRNWLA